MSISIGEKYGFFSSFTIESISAWDLLEQRDSFWDIFGYSQYFELLRTHSDTYVIVNITHREC